MKNLFITLCLVLTSLTLTAQEAFNGIWKNEGSSYLKTILASDYAVLQCFNTSFEEQDFIAEEIHSAPEWLQNAWLVGCKQGCRLSEVKVKMSDIDEHKGVILFHVKGGKTHPAPLHRDLLPLVKLCREQDKEYLVDLPIYASKLIIQWLRSKGVNDISFHCLRVTVVTRLARAGYSESQVMEYVGHCSEMVHSIYRKLQPADLKHLGDAL